MRADDGGSLPCRAPPDPLAWHDYLPRVVKHTPLHVCEHDIPPAVSVVGHAEL